MVHRLILAALLGSAATPILMAQIEREIQEVPVSALSSARSAVFAARSGSTIVVRFAGPDDLNIETAVYDTSQELVAKENPDEPRASFEYVVNEGGDYFVLGRNITKVDGTMTVLLRDGGTKGPAGTPLAVVRVYYATNRAAADAMGSPPYYLNQPAAADTAYATGHCDVRIPRNHRLGELETATIYRLDFGTDIRVIGVRPEPDRKKFFDAIAARARQSPEQQVLVFVHGFNVTFVDAARRTAQIAYDLAFNGAPVIFSWPSNASLNKYNDDAARAGASVAILKTFLEDLAAQTGAKSIHLVAHSMGNLVLTQALEELAKSAKPPRFRNAILVAPDIDASALRQMAERIHAVANRVTLYASKRDLALGLSELKGNPPRAGRSIVLAADLETIDATAAKTELTSWSHSYVGDSPMVLADLFHLLRGEPPDFRFGMDRICPKGDCAKGRAYWRFRPTAR